MVVAIWGNNDNAWMEFARRVARTAFPGHALSLKTASGFTGQTDAELQRTAAVIVEEGNARIVESYVNAGYDPDNIRQIPSNPNAPDPNHGEPQSKPSTSTYLQPVPGTEEAEAAADEPPAIDDVEPAELDTPEQERDHDDVDAPDPEVVSRFTRSGVRQIREMLKDPEMEDVFTSRFLSACLTSEENKPRPRKDVLQKLRKKLDAAEARENA